ncbi:DNA-3-methyladenine glycosylase I [Cupriavidus gilardii J11]|uniref:DNA-3-methyladenine glycosylase I n=1 Tax=Cupriavidus gilardii J11 TaxID=936133 RepID=A0A562BDX7_9BURK|nr:DNA-3-methyladenine glycosylase I [Cupriavidus gilardii]TWG83110.1 DNA-3-methyladenine glycosylase I [Cupriavidus gilardii J11]
MPPADAPLPLDPSLPRCHWCGTLEDYCRYHDTEWGYPVADDRRLFEKLCLEGFQSGLSWLTILRKREAFRSAFAGFDVEKVARFGERDVERLLGDAGIVRHRGKIEAAINNARRALELLETESSLAAYLWRYEPDPAKRPVEPVTTCPEAIALSKDLKKRGWSFVGPTTMYSLMQAMGMVNDHQQGCWAREAVARERAVFTVPR